MVFQDHKMHNIVLSLLLLRITTGAITPSGPVHMQELPETQPIIDIRLAPPANPQPEVNAEIQALEKARDSMEQEKAAKLEAAYNAALEGAKVKIGDVVSSTMRFMDTPSTLRPASFLALRSRTGAGKGSSTVRVKVLSIPPPDASIKSKLDAIEAQRTGIEAQMLDQAVQEMGKLTEVVVGELKTNLQMQMSALELSSLRSFLYTKEREIPGVAVPEGLSSQLNVRVGSSEAAYPTIAGLAQDMETRRDTAEHLERQRILELQLKLLEAENEYIKQALQGAIGSFLAKRPDLDAGSFLELTAKFGPPGITAALYGKLVAASDYQLNLHPPEEDTQDVLEQLDSATALEQVKRKAEEDDYVAAKQKMLNAEKGRIQSIVAAAFAPLKGKL